jgi:predicted nucleotidyltransferase
VIDHGLRPAHFEAMLEVLRTYPGVQKVVLFGSRAKGTFRPASDVDLCILGPSLTLDDLAAISEQLDELPMPQRVDVVLEHLVESAPLRESITREGKVVWGGG